MVLIMSQRHNKQSVEMNIVSWTFDYEKCSQLVFITKYKKLFTRFSGNRYRFSSAGNFHVENNKCLERA